MNYRLPQTNVGFIEGLIVSIVKLREVALQMCCSLPSVKSPKRIQTANDVTLCRPLGGTELGHPAERRDDHSDLAGLGSHAGGGVAGRGRRRRQPRDPARGHGHHGPQQVTAGSGEAVVHTVDWTSSSSLGSRVGRERENLRNHLMKLLR